MSISDRTEPRATDRGVRAQGNLPTEVLDFLEALGVVALEQHGGTTPLWVFNWHDFGGWLEPIGSEWHFELTLAQDENPNELREWLQAQPEAVRDLVDVSDVETDSLADLVFAGVVDADMDASATRRFGEVLGSIAGHWERREVLLGPRQPEEPHYTNLDLDQVPPVNAWVVMGSDEAFPTKADLAEQQSAADRGSYTWTWTVNKATRAGDLLLFYFVAPKKSLHFVARAVCDAFFERDTDPSSGAVFGPAQWWAYVSPLVPVEPVDGAKLRELLEQPVMRGGSGHYCKPIGIERLREHLALEVPGVDLALVLPMPMGVAGLPNPDDMTLDEWRNMADGALYPEKVVEQFVVEPLLAIALGKRRAECEVVGQYPIGRKSADHVILRDGVPVCVIETKVTVRRPIGPDWSTSPDFRQVANYARELNVPGILVDAHAVYVLSSDLQRIEREFERRTATAGDLVVIAQLALGTSQSGVCLGIATPG